LNNLKVFCGMKEAEAHLERGRLLLKQDAARSISWNRRSQHMLLTEVPGLIFDAADSPQNESGCKFETGSSDDSIE
jgi:hypothetical protein